MTAGRLRSTAIPEGAISNFGALDCVAGLSTVARSLGALVCPDGCGRRFCVWGTRYYAAIPAGHTKLNLTQSCNVAKA